jgi:hypothetical protein
MVKYAFGSKTKKEENCALDIKKHGKKITALFLLVVFVWPMIVNDGFLVYANNNSGGLKDNNVPLLFFSFRPKSATEQQ